MGATTTTLPGKGITLGISVTYLTLLVLIPLSTIIVGAAQIPLVKIWGVLSSPRTIAALELSLYASGIAALVNAVAGTIVAWVLTRYSFPGRRLFDALVDLPFALPTAVAGIALTALYAPNGMLGALMSSAGIKVAFAPLGVVVALVFVGLPFVVRTVQPVLEELHIEVEEAAATLGAGRLQTIRRVVMPTLLPSILTGFSLAFARGLGEYGSVVFISGNLPLKTEVVPLVIMSRLEQFDYAGATIVACLMLCISFLTLFVINTVQGRLRSRAGGAT